MLASLGAPTSFLWCYLFWDTSPEAGVSWRCDRCDLARRCADLAANNTIGISGAIQRLMAGASANGTALCQASHITESCGRRPILGWNTRGAPPLNYRVLAACWRPRRGCHFACRRRACRPSRSKCDHRKEQDNGERSLSSSRSRNAANHRNGAGGLCCRAHFSSARSRRAKSLCSQMQGRHCLSWQVRPGSENPAGKRQSEAIELCGWSN
jgi:hypothetical protein